MKCALIACLFAVCSVQAVAQTSSLPAPPPNFNSYIVRSVDLLARTRARGGYDINRAFTQDLSYGHEAIPATHPLIRNPGPNPTMCVAAVAEVIIEAINLYVADTHDASVYEMLSRASWTGASRLSIRANLFIYSGTGSNGTGSTLQTFGIGEERLFSELIPGDFVNLNRTTGTGHSVVFMGYLSKTGPQAKFDDNVVGFRYFSGQGKGRPDGGLGFRNAYFANHCPTPRGRNDDCNIINGLRHIDNGFRQNQVLLNTGRMYYPSSWKIKEALDRLRRSITRGLEEDALTRGVDVSVLAAQEFERVLQPDTSLYEDGSGM